MKDIGKSSAQRRADLSGQVAIVTGASSGLGWRFAQTLAANGAAVVAAARRVDKLEQLARDIENSGGQCLPVALDVTDAGQIAETVDLAQRELGLVNILVNNAGMPDAKRATKMPVELIDAVLATNLRGPWLLSCEVARRLIDAKAPGRIINLSSASAFSYRGNGAALYSTTKAAVNRMTQTLAVEWAKFGINVNAIAPGAFESEMMSGMIERVGRFHEAFPRKRMAIPSQLDSTLLYLVDPASEAVTGAVLHVDDGQGPR